MPSIYTTNSHPCITSKPFQNNNLYRFITPDPTHPHTPFRCHSDSPSKTPLPTARIAETPPATYPHPSPPSTIMRNATPADTPFLANALIAMANHLRDLPKADPISQALPDHPDSHTTRLAASFIDHPGSLALIIDAPTPTASPIACLLAKTTQPSIATPESPQVGHIFAVWVEPAHRNKGLAAQLLTEAESRFKSLGIDLLELSYFTQNTVASEAWHALGFIPYRTFAYKKI